MAIAKRKPKSKSKPKKKKPLTARQRLNAVFKDLDARGIVAMQNAGYTMSEGWEDVNEEAWQRREAGAKPRGGVFYHGQDRERLVAGDGTHLTFGAYAEGKAHERESLAIAAEVVAVLKAHGFKPKWDGTLDQRIHTGKFRWS